MDETGNPDKDKFLGTDDDKGTGNETDKFDIFLRWLSENGATHPGLTLQKYADEMRGVHATRDIAPDETICTIPLKCLITVEMGKATDVGRKILMHALQLDAPKHIFIMVYMLLDMAGQAGEDPSFFKPYYDILPDPLTSMPIFWDDEEMSWLRGSFLTTQTADRKRAIARDFHNICRIAPEFERCCTLERFMWARMIVCSRNFGITVNGLRTSAMVPYADMLNHLRPRETKWEFENAIQAFTITSLEQLTSGAQIYDSYGKKCNHRFLLNYGFALENNVESDGTSPNEISICLRPRHPPAPGRVGFRYAGESEDGSGATPTPTPPLVAEWQQLWRSLPPMNQPQAKRVRLAASTTATVSRQFFGMLRLLVANESDIKLLSAPAATPEFPSRRRPTPQAPISLRNEAAMLCALRDVMEATLHGYPTTLEQDDELLRSGELEPFSNRRHALLMVRGEKQVVHFFLKFAEQCLAVIALPTADERRAEASALASERWGLPAARYLTEDLRKVLGTDGSVKDAIWGMEQVSPQGDLPEGLGASGDATELAPGVSKRIVRAGAAHGCAAPPAPFDEIAVHYRVVSQRTGRVVSDTQMRGCGPVRFLMEDASSDADTDADAGAAPAPASSAAPPVPRGVLVAVKTMVPGERALLTLSREMAVTGTGGATLEDADGEDNSVARGAAAAAATAAGPELYDAQIWLLSSASALPPLESSEQRHEAVQIVRQMGNDKFRACDFGGAVRRYERALEILQMSPGKDSEKDVSDLADVESDDGAGAGVPARVEAKEERLMLHLNLAMCHLRLDEHATAARHCDDALNIDADNVKGLYRRGMALINMRETERARADLKRAQELDPNNAGVKKELRRLAAYDKLQREKERQMAAKMFSS